MHHRRAFPGGGEEAERGLRPGRLRCRQTSAERLQRELMDLNPSAARSLGEGMEETLTVHRLHLPMQLRKTMAGTNVIESAFSIVEQVCRNVKRWHGGGQRERWAGSGLLAAEKQFRRVQGYKQIPMLIREEEWRLSNGERRRRVGYAGVATFNGVPGVLIAGAHFVDGEEV